jgi:hypothetical protein
VTLGGKVKDKYIQIRQDDEIKEMAEALAIPYEGNVSLMVRSLIRKAFRESGFQLKEKKETQEEASA